jgi:hypothetical protein
MPRFHHHITLVVALAVALPACKDDPPPPPAVTLTPEQRSEGLDPIGEVAAGADGYGPWPGNRGEWMMYESHS